ncbi:hypothetical protein PMIN07_012149 [Paraphaeosphaeria minitans]
MIRNRLPSARDMAGRAPSEVMLAIGDLNNDGMASCRKTRTRVSMAQRMPTKTILPQRLPVDGSNSWIRKHDIPCQVRRLHPAGVEEARPPFSKHWQRFAS